MNIKSLDIVRKNNMKYYVHYDFDLAPKEVDDPAKAISYTEKRLKQETFEDGKQLEVFWRRDDLGWENKFVEYTQEELIDRLNTHGEITLQLAIEEEPGWWIHSTIVHIYTESKEEEYNKEAQDALSDILEIDAQLIKNRKLKKAKV